MAEDRERELVLAPNEYVYVMDKTSGNIQSVVGPNNISISNSQATVKFNNATKRFEECNSMAAVSPFVTVPENWYCVLKNPASDESHPRIGEKNNLPALSIGNKVMISGPASFALFPGQMAKVVKGHILRTNQYLLARIYDATRFKKEGYVFGQLLVIKGTEYPSFLPMTGMEILPITDGGTGFVRDAVTLEKLEYCILKNESGVMNYVHGPAVVFPEPDQVFVKNPENNGCKFGAIELSEISGIYVKVVADYSEGNGVVGYRTVVDDEGNEVEEEIVEEPVWHYVGEELFITGNEQKIYYPRPEHAIIEYNGRRVHHATAIPKGEGRYVLNRLNGKIRIEKGPAMFLPDPRYEVIAKRKLTAKQCELWYPGNFEVLQYNQGFEDKPVPALLDSVSSYCGVASKMLINRSETYTKPRMVTIDNKYDGVVTINVWDGYAIKVVSKQNGTSKIICGPESYMLEYEEVLETVNNEAYLKIVNNETTDEFLVRTNDMMCFNVRITYRFRFDESEEESWFSIDNYKDVLKSTIREEIKARAFKLSCAEYLESWSDDIYLIIKSMEKNFGNGMRIDGAEIINFEPFDDKTTRYADEYYKNVCDTQHARMKRDVEIRKESYSNEIEMVKQGLSQAINEKKAETVQKQYEAEAEIAKIKAGIEKEEALAKEETFNILMAQKAKEMELEQSGREKMDALTIKKNNALTKNIADAIAAISPDLIAAMTATSNAELLERIATSIAPYTLAMGTDESISDIVNKMLRGTSLEGLIEKALPLQG